MAWVVARPGLRTALFRLVDVLPSCRDDADVTRHVVEYLAGAPLPPGGAAALHLGARLPHVTATIARRGVRHLARRFIGGETPDDLVALVGGLWDQGAGATVDLLGEKTVTTEEADGYAARVAALLEALVSAAPTWPDRPRLAADRWGPVPRVNVSVKPTALCPRFDPLEGDEAVRDAAKRLVPLVERAAAAGATVHLDVEHDEAREPTYALLRTVGEAVPHADLGCVVQAYRPDAAPTLEALVDWATSSLQRPLQVRLVKGAYWDTETVLAAAHGWPAPVFLDKAETDENFTRAARYLLGHAGPVRPIVASHNLRSIADALASAEEAGLSPTDVELQLLHGMAPGLGPALVRLGYRTRHYVPMGELETGMAYLVRRLLENTSNESFVRHRELDRADLDELLRPPTRPGRTPPTASTARRHDKVLPAPTAPLRRDRTAPTASRRGDRTPPTGPRHDERRGSAGLGQGPDTATGGPADVPGAPVPFRNEPIAELRRPEARARLLGAVREVRPTLGFEAPVIIGGTERPLGAEPLVSVDPADPATVVCRAGRAGAAQVDEAMGLASSAQPAWAASGFEARAAVLRRVAQRFRTYRSPLAALIAFEAGKPLPEADADVCEAIDFCEYYAGAALRLGAGPDHGVAQAPGETNRYHYLARGVAAVISPWNFPLAIPTGMVAAALVAGNAVLFKPAEQTPGIGLALARAFWAAGVPDDVFAFLPGTGEDTGAALVAHPGTALVAFVGSLAVGRSIQAEAARPKPRQRQLPRVITELGGKNPIVVDDDADLDVAVPAIAASAFGYAGQKCSAASRLVVARSRYDEVVERLVGAARLLPVGHPTELSTVVGPLIDEDAHRRVRRYQDEAGRHGRVLLARHDLPDRGWFVGPTIVALDAPGGPLWEEEIFGPFLTVVAAGDLDEALALANDTAYALTAGFFSRSPAHLRRAADSLRAGNVYLNRATTGALVGRQAFGGYGLSGVGSKAGGPDYLLQFVDPRVVTENTLRQGFVPEL
jgi:RHH-type proline utilization regulon transcriptional repressor/proline dehydrogenase/delta 1-pyrroline-5-carboxylate dehydrogenase